jgi:hypothetical protein
VTASRKWMPRRSASVFKLLVQWHPLFQLQ